MQGHTNMAPLRSEHIVPQQINGPEVGGAPMCIIHPSNEGDAQMPSCTEAQETLRL